MPRPADTRLDHARTPDWIERPERSNILALRCMAWVATTLGRRVARLLLHPICLYFLAFSPSARSASRRYLARVLDRRPRLADLFRHYHAFASVLLDRVFLLNGQLSRFDVRLHGMEIVEETVTGGKGCILLGAHLGSFEMARAVGKARGDQIRMLMYEDNARKVGAMLRALDPDLDREVIALGRVDAMLNVEAALARGEFVGILADRTLDAADTFRCEFLGQPARFPTGPFRIALMLNRPMVLAFALYRGNNRYDVHIERLTEPGQLRRSERAAAMEELLRRYAGRLEHYCRLAPYNWFNFYDFWR